MNGQPNQGIASLTGGMGGSPTLGGAPQTPPMPQGGAQKPPQSASPMPQGEALLKLLALADIEKKQKEKARILALQTAQQNAASGGDNESVADQLKKRVEKNTMEEMMQALSGGLKQAGQMSAQAQGQPMSGGIAAAPGANQAAQPEAMAAGGIVAFKKGGTDGEEDDQPVDAYNRASNETWLGQGIRRGKAAVKDVAGLLSLRPWATDPERVAEGDTRTNAEVEGYTPEGYKVNDRADQLKAAFDRQQAARPVSDERSATTPFDPMNPWAKVGTTPAATLQGKPGNMDNPALVRREDMRRGIANVQRPPVAAAQAQRPAAIQQPSLNIQTNPNYAPPAPAPDAFQNSVQAGISGLMNTDATAEATKARDEYNRLMAVNPELAAQLKADTAAERAALQTRATREPSVYDRLRAFADVAPAGGQTWTMAGTKGAGNINRLEKEYEADRMAALSGLKGLSKAEYDKQQGEKEKLFGVGSEAAKAARLQKTEGLKAGEGFVRTQTQEKTEYARMANDLVKQGMSNRATLDAANITAAAHAATAAAMRESTNMGKLQSALNIVTNNQAKAAQEIRNDFEKRFAMLPQFTGDPDSDLSKKVQAARTALQIEQSNAIAIVTKPFEGFRQSLEDKILGAADGGTSGFKVVGKRQQ